MSERHCKKCVHWEPDARYVRQEDGEEWAHCMRPRPGVSLVTGGPLRPPFCDHERKGGWFWSRVDGKCGARGRFYKERRPE